MTIPFGRRRLMIALVAVPPRQRQLAVPEAISASDDELARLGNRRASLADRARWEADVALYGGFRPR